MGMNKLRDGYAHGLAITIAVFLVVLALGWSALQIIDSGSADMEEALVRDAIRQAVVTCYAVEGAYPDSLAYLKEHYGLKYNADQFFVSYDAFASNLMPDIRVVRKGATE